MQRKVFISFLGTSKYNECCYCKDDFSCRSRFIQEATFRYLCSKEEWTEQDRIVVLLTPMAEQRNWADGDQPGLESILKNGGFAPQIDAIRNLPNGRDEGEINDVFKAIFNYLQEGDALYLDLTHAFRYLPMLMLVLSNYAKFLKNVSVRSITYGNWEMSENGTRPAPIIDLMSLSALQDWSFAAGQYVNNGNVKELVNLNKSEYREILRDTQGRDLNARHLRIFIEALEESVAQRQTCRGLDIIRAEEIRKMQEEAGALNVSNSLFSPIYEKILGKVSEFNPDYDIANCYQGSKWCLQNGLYQQAATLLQEYIISFICDKLGLPIDDKDKRGLVSGAFNYAAEMLRPEKDRRNALYASDVRKIGEMLLNLPPSILNGFSQLSILRNDLNHAGMRTDPKPVSSSSIQSKLTTLLETFSNLAETCMGLAQIPDAAAKPVFINLSNHPSTGWDTPQREAALQYGAIVDMPFPLVLPDATEKDVDKQADELARQIQKDYPFPAVIHIMGEMTLTYALVKKLKAIGYTCLASTTERLVSFNDAGEKIVRFSFVRFREY